MILRKFWMAAVFTCFISSFGVVTGDFARASDAPATGPTAQEEVEPITRDCVNCHVEEPRDIEEAGRAHGTAVTCVDCHEGHPPRVMEVIPACSQCHSGSPHYDDIKACLSCHRNPHRPLDITLGRKLTAPCLTCHEGEGEQLKDFPSYHSQLDCTSCHEGRHGYLPACSDCHKPHEASMTEEDCHKCHQAHKPLAVAFATDIASTNCAGCHEGVFNILSQSKARHNLLQCVNCHEAEHGSIPSCSQCHTPHSKDMTADQCRDCHQAHSPMPATFGSSIASTACGACHMEPLQVLSNSGTRHQELQCLECHGTTHGSIPQCNDCHEPHAESMTTTDCLSCHAAHKPMPVAYSIDLEPSLCASCHADVTELLQASKARHRTLSCAVCHKTDHGAIPACQSCHGTPHSAQMLKKFPECGTCHGQAHDLLK